MNDLVYYLIHSPDGKGLIFPSELEDNNYYTIGSFYIATDNLSEKYIIYAVLGENIIKTNLHKVRDSSNFFINEIDKIGNFIFIAEKLNNKIHYSGKINQYKELILTYRLRIFNPTVAEQAAKKHNFYFIGFSNLIND